MANRKQEKNFKSQIENITKYKTFTLLEYKEFVDENLLQIKKGFLTKLMSSIEQEETDLIDQQKILKSFFEDELKNADRVDDDPYIKKEVAEVANTSVE